MRAIKLTDELIEKIMEIREDLLTKRKKIEEYEILIGPIYEVNSLIHTGKPKSICGFDIKFTDMPENMIFIIRKKENGFYDFVGRNLIENIIVTKNDFKQDIEGEVLY